MSAPFHAQDTRQAALSEETLAAAASACDVAAAPPASLEDAHQTIRELVDMIKRLRQVNDGAAALMKQAREQAEIVMAAYLSASTERDRLRARNNRLEAALLARAGVRP